MRMLYSALCLVVFGGGASRADEHAEAKAILNNVIKESLFTNPLKAAASTQDKAAEEKPGTQREVHLDAAKTVKLALAWIPPGKFVMREGAQAHTVTLTKGYWMGVTEITQEQWTAVMESNPSEAKGNGRLPVERVSWSDCQAFALKLNTTCKEQLKGLMFDLPTEAEWEYACRAGTQSKWSFGDDEGKLGDFAWFNGNSDRKTHPVGEKGANAWGLYDMHGNVWEWCKDLLGAYTGDATDSIPTAGDRCSPRGGSVYNGAIDCGSAYRNRDRFGPAVRLQIIGCRVVLR